MPKEFEYIFSLHIYYEYEVSSMEQIRKLKIRKEKECMSKAHYVMQATSASVSKVQTDKQ